VLDPHRLLLTGAQRARFAERMSATASATCAARRPAPRDSGSGRRRHQQTAPEPDLSEDLAQAPGHALPRSVVRLSALADLGSLQGRSGLNTYVSIAEKWYASATFYAATGVAVTLVIGVATVLVAYVVGFPKRRLLYAMPVLAPLLSAPADVQGDLELRRHGTVLTDPHLLEIRLVARGRKDIPSSAYDSGEPIRFDVGARIVELLRSTSDPQSDPLPKYAFNGTTLTIGPSRIGKRQIIAFTLLTDGERPCLTCQSSLIDVQVRQQKPEDLIPAWAIALSAFSVVSTLLAVLALSAASSARSAARSAASLQVPAAVAVQGIHKLMQHRETAGSEIVKLLTNGSGKSLSASLSDLLGNASATTAVKTSTSRAANFETLAGWALAALAAGALVTVVITLLRRRARRAAPQLR
jgi:hypothetical protein